MLKLDLNHLFLDRALGLTIVILLCVSFVQAAPSSWNRIWEEIAEIENQNSFDNQLYVSCNGLEGMYKVSSVHSNHHEDRTWNWECRNVVGHGYSTGCHQTDYVNDWDMPMFFMCPANTYITVVDSYHDNGREDRRWKFRCCGVQGHVTTSCRHTGYLNDWDGPLNFQADSDELITGVYSYHDNGKE